MASDVTVPNEVDLIGREAAYLSAIEIGLGSLLHGLSVPFAGYFLSLNQGFFLSRAVAQALKHSRTVPFSISIVAAILKSLSPAGKKLTPMLAISMQGALFTLGTMVLGANLLGAIAGAVLASVWAFAQPLIVYWILYGQTLIQVIRYYQDKFPVLWIFMALVALKAALSAGLAVAAFYLSDRRFESYRSRMTSAARGRREAEGAARVDAHSWSAGARGAVRDLLNPLFLISLAMTAGFFMFSEASAAALIWRLLRPVALAFLLFFFIRIISFERLLVRLERSRFKNLGRSLEVAIRTLKRL